MNGVEEEVLLSGTWLYDGTIENEVHIYKTNFKPGSGDHEDEPYVKDDQFGIFYDIHIGKYADRNKLMSGGYNSIEEAKNYASKVCPLLKWK